MMQEAHVFSLMNKSMPEGDKTYVSNEIIYHLVALCTNKRNLKMS